MKRSNHGKCNENKRKFGHGGLGEILSWIVRKEEGSRVVLPNYDLRSSTNNILFCCVFACCVL